MAHDAYQYFEHRFDLTTDVTLTAGDSDRAGARRTRDVREHLVEGGVACLLAEPGDRVAERLVAGTDITVARIDPLGATLPNGPSLYTTVLETMAQAIVECRE